MRCLALARLLALLGAVRQRVIVFLDIVSELNELVGVFPRNVLLVLELRDLLSLLPRLRSEIEYVYVIFDFKVCLLQDFINLWQHTTLLYRWTVTFIGIGQSKVVSKVVRVLDVV